MSGKLSLGRKQNAPLHKAVRPVVAKAMVLENGSEFFAIGFTGSKLSLSGHHGVLGG